MKSTKVLLAAAALVLSLGAYSQTDSVKRDSSTQTMDTTKKHTDVNHNQGNNTLQGQSNTNTNTTQPATTGTTTTSTDISNVPKPNFGRYYIPALGSYNAVASTTDNKSIKVTGDETNPGKIWVEGLTDTKFYALLKAAPGTYKIPAQKQDDKTVAEGTLIYDESTKQITLCSGCGYKDDAPTASATEEITPTDATANISKNKKQRNNKPVVKTKKVPVISFTGTKADQGTVSILQ